MSKKKESNPLPPAGPQPPEAAANSAGPAPVYDFSHGRRCPRCRQTDTVCRSTQGGIQYRKCLRALCRTVKDGNYTVVGKEV